MQHPALYASQDALDYLDKARNGKIKEASKFGHTEIDDYLRFKRNEFVVVSGHANVGKTHSIMYLMLLHTKRNGTKWMVFSSENEVGSLQRKLIEFKLGKIIKESTDAEFYDAHSYVLGHFRFIRTDVLYDIFSLLDTCQELYDEEPYDGLLIDPYNSLTINQKSLGKVSTHEYHYEATSRIRIFCKKNDVTTILNTHPATEALRRTYPKGHEYEGHPMPPMASDIEGGGKFQNRADCVAIIHRLSQHPQDWIFTDIHVRKVKDIETGGRPTPLHEPIRIRSERNNVGFSIGSKNLMYHPHKIEADEPF